MLYQSSLEHKNFVNLKETQFFLSVIKSKSLLYQRLVRDEKIREVLISSFFELIIKLLLMRY